MLKILAGRNLRISIEKVRRISNLKMPGRGNSVRRPVCLEGTVHNQVPTTTVVEWQTHMAGGSASDQAEWGCYGLPGDCLKVD